jgi:negative regulator of sigma E activity
MTEKNSSLFDNEIKEEDIGSLISSEIKDPNMRRQWFYYQTIRDVVRGEYSGSSNLSKKIMDAIDEEPTQMRGYSPAKELVVDSNFYNWQLVLGFAVLFTIVFAGLNSKNENTVTPVQLVYEEMPAEIMNAHFANTSSTANYFVQTTFINK